MAMSTCKKIVIGTLLSLGLWFIASLIIYISTKPPQFSLKHFLLDDVSSSISYELAFQNKALQRVCYGNITVYVDYQPVRGNASAAVPDFCQETGEKLRDGIMKGGEFLLKEMMRLRRRPGSLPLQLALEGVYWFEYLRRGKHKLSRARPFEVNAQGKLATNQKIVL